MAWTRRNPDGEGGDHRTVRRLPRLPQLEALHSSHPGVPSGIPGTYVRVWGS